MQDEASVVDDDNDEAVDDTTVSDSNSHRSVADLMVDVNAQDVHLWSY